MGSEHGALTQYLMKEKGEELNEKRKKGKKMGREKEERGQRQSDGKN